MIKVTEASSYRNGYFKYKVYNDVIKKYSYIIARVFLPVGATIDEDAELKY